jgi:hypothetical protein
MPHLRGYVCDLYATPGIAASVNMRCVARGLWRPRLRAAGSALQGAVLSVPCTHTHVCVCAQTHTLLPHPPPPTHTPPPNTRTHAHTHTHTPTPPTATSRLTTSRRTPHSTRTPSSRAAARRGGRTRRWRASGARASLTRRSPGTMSERACACACACARNTPRRRGRWCCLLAHVAARVGWCGEQVAYCALSAGLAAAQGWGRWCWHGLKCTLSPTRFSCRAVVVCAHLLSKSSAVQLIAYSLVRCVWATLLLL